jgi:hypothetical protein
VTTLAVGGQQPASPVGVLYALSDSGCPGFARQGSGNLAIFGGAILVKADCTSNSFAKSGTGMICVYDHHDIDDPDGGHTPLSDDDNGDGVLSLAERAEWPTSYTFDQCTGDGDISIDGAASCPVSGCASDPDLKENDFEPDQIKDPLARLPGPDIDADFSDEFDQDIDPATPSVQDDSWQDPDLGGPLSGQQAFT